MGNTGDVQGCIRTPDNHTAGGGGGGGFAAEIFRPGIFCVSNLCEITLKRGC